jgi:hypothetical protein
MTDYVSIVLQISRATPTARLSDSPQSGPQGVALWLGWDAKPQQTDRTNQGRACCGWSWCGGVATTSFSAGQKQGQDGLDNVF